MLVAAPIQLPLLSDVFDVSHEERSLIGLWLGGERWIHLSGRLVSAFVFFHFMPEGEAAVTIRAEDVRQPVRVAGRWWVEGEELVLDTGANTIRAPYRRTGDVLRWANEVLVRRAEGSQPVPAMPAAGDSTPALAQLIP